jgi:hypothetical protein
MLIDSKEICLLELLVFVLLEMELDRIGIWCKGGSCLDDPGGLQFIEFV